MVHLLQTIDPAMSLANVNLFIDWCHIGLSRDEIRQLVTISLLLILLGVEIAIVGFIISKWIRQKHSSSRRRALLAKGILIVSIVIGLVLTLPGIYLNTDLQKCLPHGSPETRPQNIHKV